jgi:cyclic-di-GMP-binding protein
MASFDIVSEVNKQELRNAVDQANKEISARYDFKGSDARVEQNEYVLTLYADDEFKLGQVRDILTTRMAKRGIDLKAVDLGKLEKIGGDKTKQLATVRVGVDSETAKKIVKHIKESGVKAQASIQGEAVRVTSAKKDTLQEVIASVRKADFKLPLQFGNYRD